MAAGSDVGERAENGYTPLLLVAYFGHTEVCELLLAAGSDVEERMLDTLGTPLHYAAGKGHERIIQLLLSHKADVNSRNRIESTPLHLASQEGHLACVKILLQAGADPLLPDNHGFSGQPSGLEESPDNQAGVGQPLLEVVSPHRRGDPPGWRGGEVWILFCPLC